MNVLIDLRRALSLLTILPVRVDWDDERPPGRAMAYYPLVGLGIGALLVGLAAVLTRVTAGDTHPLLSSAILLTCWVAVTGALHLDGWGDACDALLSTVDRERRLAILRDPRLGSFGGVGLTLLLLLKLSAISALGRHSLLLLPPALGRWAVVIAARAWPSARPGGMGDRFRQGVGRREVIASTVTALALAAIFGWMGLLGLATAALGLFALGTFAARRLGGLTGDIYGAIIEGVEALVLIALALASA